MRRASADRVDGVLALDKPLGISSNLALQKARRLLNARKAGHTGTLDPLASGLLPLTFGEATKFSADLLEADKEYEARIALGVVTTTGDAEGEALEQRAVDVTPARLAAVLERFTGCREQVPPMYSALKRDGRPLYELARQGREVERLPRRIVISRLELLHWDERRPLIRVECSKGTYVRVLAQEIGEALGCGAHLGALRRTRVGHLRLDQAVTLAALESMDPSRRRSALLPVDALLSNLPRVVLDGTAAAHFGHGQPVALAASIAGEAPRVRVYDGGGRLLGVARSRGGWLEATRLVAQAECAEPCAGATAQELTDEPVQVTGIEEAP